MNGSDPKLSSQIPQIRILCLSLLAVWLLASYLTLLKLSVFQFPISKMRRRIIPIKYACYENTIYIFKIENKWWFIYHINKSIHSISLKKKNPTSSLSDNYNRQCTIHSFSGNESCHIQLGTARWKRFAAEHKCRRDRQ